MEPYPADYETTLAELAVWRANQTNAAVQAQLDRAVEETSGLSDRLSTEPDYLSGLAKGVQAARGVDPGECPRLLSFDLQRFRRQAASSATPTDRGYQDGQLLVLGLELVRRLPGCFVPVPEPYVVERTARQPLPPRWHGR